ncbi:SRPBCC family protein [Tumebacillus lipolyticus]|uniref:SRPBCC domain-containing protein n=1 Tax=Tumebacillus lipolyticus TaxID=1280370 RepID=A0ABW4ZVT0_9BACL
MESIKHHVEVACSKEIAWLAWTDQERIVKWFAPAANIEAQVGGAYELFFDPEHQDRMGTKGCTVTQFESMERLTFTWKGPDQFAEIMNHDGLLTTVSVTFSAAADHTEVAVEHAGFGEGEAWEQAHAWHQMAWQQVLSSLKSAIESGEGELCCTPEQGANA